MTQTIEDVLITLSDPKKAAAFYSFWESPRRQEWPQDQDGYTFLLHALLRTGRLLFPQEWNDDADPANYLGSWGLKVAPDAELARADFPQWTDDFFERNAERFRQELRKVSGSVRRFRTADMWLAKRFASGEIKSGFRAWVGGNVAELDAGEWKTEFFAYRFITGQLLNPFDVDPYAPRIFVELDSLEHAIEKWRTEDRQTIAAVSAETIAEGSDEDEPEDLSAYEGMGKQACHTLAKSRCILKLEELARLHPGRPPGGKKGVELQMRKRFKPHLRREDFRDAWAEAVLPIGWVREREDERD